MRDRNITIAVVLLLAFAASAVYDDSAGTGQAFLQGNQKCAQAFGALTMEKVQDGSIPAKVDIKRSYFNRKSGSCTREDIIRYNQLMKVPRVTNWETYNDNKDISGGNELIVVDAVAMYEHKTGNEVIDTFIEFTGEANSDVTHYVAIQETPEKLMMYKIKDVKKSKQNLNTFKGNPIGATNMLPEGVNFNMNPFYVAGDMGNDGVARFTFLRNPSTGNSITGGSITGIQLAGGNGETVSPGPHGDSEKACEVSTTTAGTKSITCSKNVVVGQGNCKSDADCNAANHLDCVASACTMVAGAGGDECTSDAECAGPGTGTYAEEVPKEEEGYSLSDLWDGFAYVGDLELTWDSFTDNTDCYFEIGSSGFDDSSIGFVGFGANTNLWSGDHLTFNLGGTVGMRNFDLDSEFEENFDTGEPNFETGGNIWDTRTVTGPGEGWEFGATIGPNINIPFEAPALGAFSLDFKAEALLCETGSGYINEAKLNKALSDSVSTFVSTQSGRVDGMDMGTTTMFGFKYNF